MKVFEGLVNSFAPGGVVQATQVENLENLERPLLLHCRFRASNYAKRAGDLLLLRPWGRNQIGGAWDGTIDGRSRQYPVELPYASLENEAVDITLPIGYAMEELPAPLDLERTFGEYHSHGALTGAVLEYTRRYESKALLIPVEHWNEWQKFQAQIRAEESNHTVLKAVR